MLLKIKTGCHHRFQNHCRNWRDGAVPVVLRTALGECFPGVQRGGLQNGIASSCLIRQFYSDKRCFYQFSSAMNFCG